MRGLTPAVAVALLAAGCGSVPPPAPEPAAPARTMQVKERTLFLALDAVDYDVVAELTDPARKDRLFDYLEGPVPLVSTFPSATTVAFTGILEPIGIEKPYGYEAQFFDREQGKIRGGGVRSYNKLKASWREFFDWRIQSIVKKNVGFVRPVHFGQSEVAGAVEKFLASDEELFFAYVSGTDGAGHLKGPKAVEQVLVELDAVLRRADEEGPPHRVVIFSDHGMAGGEPLDNVRKGVRRAMKDAGFHLGKRLREEDDAVIVAYGLLSSFVLYTQPGEEARAASAIAGVEGVDVCATAGSAGADGDDPSGWRIYSARGNATVHHRPGPHGGEWAYRPEGGDPLGYLEGNVLPAGLFGDGQTELWLPDREWFDATLDSEYPDGLYRIASAFQLVQNPASVICSVAAGHMYGPFLTEWSGRIFMGRLRYTHGALRRDDTLGFLLTNHPDFQPRKGLRFDTSLVPYVEGELDKLRP